MRAWRGLVIALAVAACPGRASGILAEGVGGAIGHHDLRGGEQTLVAGKPVTATTCPLAG